MLNTFKIGFRIRSSYKTNSFIYHLRSLPLIKKIIPSTLYGRDSLKTFTIILTLIKEFLSIFFNKGLYLLLIFLSTSLLKANPADSFAHIIIFLTIIGGFLNTNLFTPTIDKFYAINIMGLNAREYAISDYIYFLLKTFIGFLTFSIIFGLLSGMSVLACICVPVFVVSTKLCFSAYSLRTYKKDSKLKNDSLPKALEWIGIALLLLVAYLPPYLGYAISDDKLVILTLLLVIPSIFALRYVLSFDEYRRVYKELLDPNKSVVIAGKEAVTKIQQESMSKKISIYPNQTSDKSGYKYFNEIFMKRHSSLLTKSAKKITLVSLIIFAFIATLNFIFFDESAELNEMLHSYLPYFLFVMYMTNRGNVITQAFFMNCDHSMLTYSFYRQPKAILLLFIERLKYIILINLIPAVAIALEYIGIMFISGGSDNPLNYLLTFTSIISMSVFFSVHTIVLYYLFQPYNAELESKGWTYNIANTITYLVCYFAINLRIPTLVFGSAITVFCLVYIVIAFILAYRLAPKTFKLNQ